MKVFIKENSWFGRQAAKRLKVASAAIVIKNTIHLWGVSRASFLQNCSWVRHEIAHVHQFKKYGFVRFVFLYLAETVRTGYYNNRFEAEARSKEEDATILNDIQFR